MRFIAEDTAEKCYTFLVDYIIERINNYKSPDGSMMGIVLPTYNTVTAPLYETIFLFYCGPGDYLLFFYSFKELVAAFQAGKVSFRYVRLYQLEEYLGVNKFDECSKAFQLFSEFLKFVDMPHENVNFIQADSPNIIEEVKRYEKCIVDNGGIDLAIVEVNSDGGIGGNDPGSGLTTRTRVKTLSDFVFNDRCHTRQGLIDIDPKLYINLDKPGYTCVVTMGLQTLLECKEVVQLFIGFNKARALHRCVEGSIHNMFPASIFQLHQRPCIVADKSALGELRLNTIQYYLGLRETYNTVHKMNRNINTEESSPYRTANRYISTLSTLQLNTQVDSPSYRVLPTTLLNMKARKTSLNSTTSNPATTLPTAGTVNGAAYQSLSYDPSLSYSVRRQSPTNTEHPTIQAVLTEPPLSTAVNPIVYHTTINPPPQVLHDRMDLYYATSATNPTLNTSPLAEDAVNPPNLSYTTLNSAYAYNAKRPKL